MKAWHSLFVLCFSWGGLALAADAGRGESPPDWLGLARAYADCMIEFGRDRYGDEASPLFSTALTREPQPMLLPYPIFEPLTPFVAVPENPAERSGDLTWFRFNDFLNIPTLREFGSADAHKETVVGEDALENLSLYRLLFLLSETTGEAKYALEAEKALDWWLSRTQSPATGLYPWGEHLGWDFRNENVSYSTGPYTILYSRMFHEPRANRFEDVLERLAQLPAASPVQRTPLERFALGLRDWHIWDLENAYFTRHGDYFGFIRPEGSADFPRIAGWFFDVWSAALAASGDPAFKQEMAGTIETFLAGLRARIDKVGFLAFTSQYELALEGKSSGKPKEKNAKPTYNPRQTLIMAGKCAVAARRIEREAPELSGRLARFADEQIRYYLRQANPQAELPGMEACTILDVAEMTGRDDMRQALKHAADFAARNPLSPENPDCRGNWPWAYRIRLLAGAARTLCEPSYLDAARRDAAQAAALFFDGASPLPRCSSDPVHLPDGREFRPYYHAVLGGADLMLALGQLGAMENASGPLDLSQYTLRLLRDSDFSAPAPIAREEGFIARSASGEWIRTGAPDASAEWIAEGWGGAEIRDGRLFVAPTPFGANGDPLPAAESERSHMVVWNRAVFPADFLLEFEVCHHGSNDGLTLFFFCATGLEGEDLFDMALPVRRADYPLYHSDRLRCYSLSYWSRNRGEQDALKDERFTARLRRNPGKRQVAWGPSRTLGSTEKSRTVRLLKAGARIEAEIEGEVVLRWDDPEPPLGAGRIGLRSMSGVKQVSYDNFRVWAVEPKS